MVVLQKNVKEICVYYKFLEAFVIICKPVMVENLKSSFLVKLLLWYVVGRNYKLSSLLLTVVISYIEIYGIIYVVNHIYYVACLPRKFLEMPYICK